MNEHIIRMLLGLGLDGNDEHVRITKGPNFQLFGGSEPTHERMQLTCMRFNEELHRRGKALNEISPEEARAIIREIEQRM